MKKNLIFLLAVLTLSACAVSGRLERRQATAELLHVTRRQREREQDTPPALRVERDSGRLVLVRAEQLDGEQVMVLDIPQVTVQARARTLPERLGCVRIDFRIDLPRTLQGAARSVEVVPMLHKYGHAEPLKRITLRGGLFSRVQQRDYWQYDRYVRVFRPDPRSAERAFTRMVKYPYSEGVRLDSVVQHPGHVSYYYSQEVPTDETSKTMLVTLQGWVVALDGSYYRLPPSDTLTYHVSSMLSFVDTTARYKIRVIDKYATLEERRYVQFMVGGSRVIDTLGHNSTELHALTSLLDTLGRQREFLIDSLILTASASPEGPYERNRALARDRAEGLRDYLRRRAGAGRGIPMVVRWVAEDWQELRRRIDDDPEVRHARQIERLIDKERDPDVRERRIAERFHADYRHIRQHLYPWLRAVSVRCHLRRVGMVKDTIHTREIDTAYMRGLKLLQRRQYAPALYVLNDYRDRNTVVALLSLGLDAQASALLDSLPPSSVVEYLRAVACSRLGRKAEGREHFLRACELDSRMQFRGNLDPEITELLKE